MRIFEHEGCRSGLCVFEQCVQALLFAREMSDQKNHDMEKRHAEELLQEAGRLLEEKDLHNLRDDVTDAKGPSDARKQDEPEGCCSTEAAFSGGQPCGGV